MTIQYVRVTMPDGSQWDIAVSALAWKRAQEVTLPGPFFTERLVAEQRWGRENPQALTDWSVENLNWDQVKPYAKVYTFGPWSVYHEGWAKGVKEIVDRQVDIYPAHTSGD